MAFAVLTADRRENRRMTRGDIWLMQPATAGLENAATPCLVVSPDELCGELDVVTVAPLKRGAASAGFRGRAAVAGEEYSVLLEQLTTLDKRALTQRVGALDRKALAKVLATLREMFAE